MMRVGINARCFSANQTGIGRYVDQICRVLIEKECEIICYLPCKMHSSFTYIDKIKYRESNARGVFGKYYWENYELPSAISEDKINVFWEPAHRLPGRIVHKVPTVLTIHDLVWLKAPRTMRFKSWLAERLFTPHSINSADVIVTASQSTKNDLEAHFPLKQSNIKVVTPGTTTLSAPEFLSSEEKVFPKAPFILCVGTVEPRKNHKTLLKAYAKLPNNLKQKAHLMIVGGHGWGGINIEELIKELDLANYVHYLKYVSDQDLARLYQDCLFLAMPSLYEGFGMPLVEAMSYGKPVLTSNISSMPEVSKSSGVLVSPESVTEIEKALIKLISSNQFRSSLSIHAKSNAAEFCWNKSSDELLEAFYKAMFKARAA